MKSRLHSSLATHALLLGFINAGFVLLLGLIMMGTAYHRDLLDFMQAPVRDRILAVSRKIALDLFENDSESWDSLLKREAEGTPFRFVLLDSEGRPIAGEHGEVPASVLRFARSGKTELSYSPRYNQLDRPDRQYSRDNVLLQRDGKTKVYWAGVHVLIHYMDENMYGHGTLIWEFPALWTNSYFFNFWPYILLLGGSLALTMLLWLPAMGMLLRRISRLTNATREIAKGNFNTPLPAVTHHDEIGELTQSIASMARQISSLVHQQQRFVSDAAHELCSPVSRLQIAMELLQGEQRDTAESTLARQQREQRFNDLSEEVQQISELIQDLLYYSRARNGRLPLQSKRMNVGNMIRSTIDREGLTDRVWLEVPENIEINVPEAQVRRAVANLLRNACQHGGGKSLEASSYQDDRGVHIIVRDAGPGLPEEELEAVFAPFYRVEYARTRHTGGTGLGLAIVKSSVEACGGVVTCRNRRPHGLEVEVLLPGPPLRAPRLPVETQVKETATSL